MMLAEPVRQKLPLSTSRDMPKVVSMQLTEVWHFLEKIESLFKAAGRNNDEEHKEKVTEYVNAEMNSK